MRLPRLRCLAAFAFAASLAHAASFDDRVEALFQPLLGEKMALSPDGQRLAYTRRARGDLSIVVVNAENPGPRQTIPADTDQRTATAAKESVPTPLRFLRWATDTRLVFAPAERVVPLPPITDKNGRTAPNPDGPTIVSPVLAVDADGQQRGVLVDAANFQETPAEAVQSLSDLLRTPGELAAVRGGPVRWRMPHLDILGFHPREKGQLIVGTHGAYSMPMRHLVDVRTASVRQLGEEWPPPPGEPQVYDWFLLKVVGVRQEAARPTTAWTDADLARVQRELGAKFPRRIVELLDWSDNRQRVLFQVTGGSDAGRIFIYQRTEDLVLEVLNRAPWLNAAKLHETQSFEFEAPEGARLSGYLTWPSKPPPNPPPLLVVLPSGFPGRAQPAFDPEAQILADLGFAVARLNHRSVAGLRAQDVPALGAAIDRVAVGDARSAVEWIATRHTDRPFDRKRVVALGRGFGGFIALRALQLQPAVFRCAIALDAPLNLGPWLRTPEAAEAAAPTQAGRDLLTALIESVGADEKKFSILDQVETLANPVLLLTEPGRRPAVDAATGELRARLQQQGRAADYLALDPGFAIAQPASRAAAYRKIEEFLTQRLNHYAVKIGPTEEVK